MPDEEGSKELKLDELKNYVDQKFKELEIALRELETKAIKEPAGKSLEEPLRKFEDLAISLSALALGVASDVASKLSETEKGAEYAKLVSDLGERGKEAKLKLADSLESLAKKLRE